MKLINKLIKKTIVLIQQSVLFVLNPLSYIDERLMKILHFDVKYRVKKELIEKV